MARKCECPGGETLYLLGEELDPCDYKEIERHENVTVLVSRCRRCGHILVEWLRTPETVDHYYEEEKEV